jgi:segregation and condensation protein B
METLAVVAYRQPVLRAEIEAIRGVQCGELLRQLMERDLVRIAGRSEELGRPFLYGTTRRFLQVFGLRHLDELPPVETELAIEEMSDISGDGPLRTEGRQAVSAQSDESRLTEEESTVRIEIEGQVIAHPGEELSLPLEPEQIVQAEFEDESSFDDDEDDDYEDEDDDDYEEDEDDFEDSEEDSDEEIDEEEDDDDGFEDSEWEEVEDDEEWEDEEWDDDEDDEWEDDDEEEEEEEDEDWE